MAVKRLLDIAGRMDPDEKKRARKQKMKRRVRPRKDRNGLLVDENEKFMKGVRLM